MKVVLSQLIRRFTVELDPLTPLPVKPERRGLTSGISPLWLRVQAAEAQGVVPEQAETQRVGP